MRAASHGRRGARPGYARSGSGSSEPPPGPRDTVSRTSKGPSPERAIQTTSSIGKASPDQLARTSDSRDARAPRPRAWPRLRCGVKPSGKRSRWSQAGKASSRARCRARILSPGSGTSQTVAERGPCSKARTSDSSTRKLGTHRQAIVPTADRLDRLPRRPRWDQAEGGAMDGLGPAVRARLPVVCASSAAQLTHLLAGGEYTGTPPQGAAGVPGGPPPRGDARSRARFRPLRPFFS